MLNLVCHLSGIATTTAAWVDAVAGTNAKIRDTRKTLPGLRALQKYAVRVGGGVNHRMGLGRRGADQGQPRRCRGFGGGGAAGGPGRGARPAVEVEVDSLEQLDEVLDEEPHSLSARQLSGLADADCRPAPRCPRAGNQTRILGRACRWKPRPHYAGTGVDYLAVGALTHSVRVLDVGLDV